MGKPISRDPAPKAATLSIQKDNQETPAKAAANVTGDYMTQSGRKILTELGRNSNQAPSLNPQRFVKKTP